MSTTAAPSASLRAAPSSFRRAQKLTAAWPTFSSSKFLAEFPSPPRARKEPSERQLGVEMTVSDIDTKQCRVIGPMGLVF